MDLETTETLAGPNRLAAGIQHGRKLGQTFREVSLYLSMKIS